MIVAVMQCNKNELSADAADRYGISLRLKIVTFIFQKAGIYGNERSVSFLIASVFFRLHQLLRKFNAHNRHFDFFARDCCSLILTSIQFFYNL